MLPCMYVYLYKCHLPELELEPTDQQSETAEAKELAPDRSKESTYRPRVHNDNQ